MCLLGSTPIVRKCPKCDHSLAKVVGLTSDDTLLSCQRCGNHFSLKSEIKIEKSKRQKRLKNFQPVLAHQPP